MNKKSTLVLLSILHICILGICILTIYSNKHSGVTVAHISSDTKTTVSLNEPQTMVHTETAAGTETETEMKLEIETASMTEAGLTTETEAAPETETKTETEVQSQPESEVLCTFHFIGTHKNLNIRSSPSSQAKIIGKIPVGGSGNVLELTNEYWALIEYRGVTGYCSRGWIELQGATE